MSETAVVNDFATKFDKLNEPNQRYIIAIQQALLYAQEQEAQEKETKGKRSRRRSSKAKNDQ